MDVLGYAAVAVFSYLLGSIPSGVIAARAFGRGDVRTNGSGHTGAINTFRVAGLAPASLTLLADGAKGVLAITAARLWEANGWATAIAATLVVIGHCYPLFGRFRGGMGLATGGGVMLVLQPVALVITILAWFLIRWQWRSTLPLLSGDQSRREGQVSTYASLAAALLLPVILLWGQVSPNVLAAGVGVAGVVFLRHFQVLMVSRRQTSGK